MKVIAVLLGLSLSLCAFSQQFVIKGKTANMKDPLLKVYLSYRLNGSNVLDSCLVVDGKYQFRGTVTGPLLASLRASYQASVGKRPVSMKRDIVQLYLENSKIRVNSKDSFAHATVRGSGAHTAYLDLKKSIQPETDRMAALNREYSELNRKKDEAGKKKIEAEYETLEADLKGKYKSYVEKNPASPVALYALGEYAGYNINADEVEPVFLKLSPANRESQEGKEMADRIEKAKRTGIGKPAPEFTQNDTLGLPVSLSSFRGKYVLIDFWASWCGPCRVENPNIVEAFRKYQGKGFTVLGVSLDQPNAKEKWMKAIRDDKLTWTQVSDLKFWKNEVATLYGIQAIPQNFLVDPKGIIIARDLRGEALQQKLAELFQ